MIQCRVADAFQLPGPAKLSLEEHTSISRGTAYVEVVSAGSERQRLDGRLQLGDGRPDRRPVRRALRIRCSCCSMIVKLRSATFNSRQHQLGKLTMPRCAVMPGEKNRGVARDTVRRRDPE